MKRIKFLSAGILMAFVVMAQIKTGSSFEIRIEINRANKNTEIYLAYQIDGRKIIDSAVLRDGIYIFSGMIDRPLNATLVADEEGLGLPAFMEKTRAGANIDILNFYLHPGVINIKADKLISNAKFTGSAINADNQKLEAILRPIKDQQADIKKQLRENNERKISKDSSENSAPGNELSTDQKLSARLNTLKTAERSVLQEFISENPNSYIALIALERYAGSFSDPSLIEPMYKQLSAAVQNTIEGQKYYKFLMNLKDRAAGTKAPDFTQNDPTGKPVSLSSFKGKYVLLDFWASWCGPCRAQSPELVRIFNDFKDKNCTILGVSLDAADGRNSWLKAIKDDHLSWAQVSDLKQWNSQAVMLYGIEAIPQTFLVDPKGIIIAKGLGHKELREKLQELLSE